MEQEARLARLGMSEEQKAEERAATAAGGDGENKKVKMTREERYYLRSQQKIIDAAAAPPTDAELAAQLSSDDNPQNRQQQFKGHRRGSMLMLRASTSLSGRAEYRRNLFARISSCTSCKGSLTFCDGCGKYVKGFLVRERICGSK